MKPATAQNGFTLIELLVVIAIIGLLSSIVLASLNGARKKSRDARRIADLRQIQTALELYANDHNGGYPANGNTTATNALSLVLAPTYISTLPKDPLGPDNSSTGYRYCSNANGYTLLTHIEKTGVPYWCGIENGNNPCNWHQYANKCF